MDQGLATADGTDVIILEFRNGSVIADTLIRDRSAIPVASAAKLLEELRGIQWSFDYDNISYPVNVTDTSFFDACLVDNVCDNSSTLCKSDVSGHRFCECRPEFTPLPNNPVQCQRAPDTTSTSVTRTPITSTPATTTPIISTTQSPGLSVGTIVGIVFAVFFAVVIFLAILYYIFCGR